MSAGTRRPELVASCSHFDGYAAILDGWLAVAPTELADEHLGR